ncbi:DUF5979 domain-containing protein [Nocardioides alcanivorans]|uniref:DUF5979 domain-containing protein n=1 Tax=Nocardioides alcanivorans TaxID=2897352 RepID=UPI001F1ED3AA|nr:DUF5979 domain-containing protein [Nocardioides alcanivorans]
MTLEKTVRPSNAVNPGQSVIASLEANATAIGDGAILDEILVEDVWAGDCGGFWNAFDIAGLAPTQVPADTTLTLRVQDTAGSWHDVSTYGPEGAATVHQISASDFAAALAAAGLSADDVVGVQVGFTDPSGLPSDTTVVPNLVFEARGDLRDPDCAAPPLDTEVTYVNTATAAAAGESEGGKPLAADDEDTAQGIVEIPSTAPGPMDIDKAWNKASVFAQSGEQANTSLRWNVGEGFSPVTITDMSDPAGAGYDVADEVFDAFDLFAVNLILPSSDPYSTGWFLKYDTVTKVELFNDETSTWEEVTAPGGSWMTANRGFKGHDLTAPERRTTIGVRVTLEETAADTAAREAAQQPGAGFDAFAPKPGTGVGSGSADRVFDLTWQVRDKLRSDGSFVVQEQTYNTADESVVNNTVTLTGDPIGGGASVTDRDSDTILIIDPEPLVEVSKSVDPTSDIFTPPVGTPAADYPTATWSITGNNASVGRASYVRLTDPAVCTDTTLADCQTDGDVAGATGDPFDTSRDWLTQSSNPNPFERFDATGIMIAASEPDQVDLDATTVWLLHHNGGTYTTTQHTATEVTAMSATDLADVVGISVTFQDTDPATSGGTITQPNDLTIVIESQLRATYRSSGDDLVLAAGQTEEQTNRVFAQSYDPITSPGTKTGDVAHATAELTGGVVNILPSKSISPQQITQPQHDVDDDNVTVTVGANQGAGPRSTLSPQQVVIEDQADSPEFWNAFDFTGLGSVTLPAGADQVQVDLFDGTDWIPGTPSADGLPLPGGVANADVQGIRFTFSRADGALFSGTVPAPNWSAAAVFTANLRETYRDDPSAPVVLDPDNPIHNTQTSQSTRPDGNDSEAKAADAEVTFYAGTQEIAVRKVTNEGDRLASPGDAVPFDLTLRNTGTGYLTVTDLVDVLPAELVYTGDPEPIFTPDPGGSLSDQVTVTPSADGTTIVFTWPDGGNIMEPGEEFGIRLFLELQPGLGAGETAVNEITVTTEEELSRCTNVESGGSTTGAWNEDAHTCGTTDYIGTVIGPNLYTAKGVRGSLPGAYRPGSPEFACAQNLRATGGAYYRPACVANSQVGGTDEWVLHTVNSGTVDLAEMTVFDQLPVAGDKSLVSGDGRDSAYRPQVVADSVQVTAPAGTSYVVQVTTDADVCVGTWDDLPNQPACEQSGESWVDADAGTDWSKVSGLRVVLDFAGTQAGALRAGEFVDVNFSTLNVLENDDDVSGSSRVVPADDQIAWNQHGVKFRYATETRWRQIAPSKVGVHLRVGSIQVTKEVTGPASGYAPGEFLVDLACRVGTGADAEELDLGADAVLELNGGNGHTYRVDGIPLSEQGTTCTFAEQGEVGEFGETTRAGDPSTVAVIQPTDPSRPIADQGVPSTQITTITNDYQFTGLSLTKLVDTEATDVDFGPFAFTVACVTGTGVPVTVDADGNTEFSFELEDGGTWTAPADTIPVGSVCTVTETDSDAADHRVYVGDNVVDNGDGSATVTPGVDPAAVQVTNGYEAGTFTLEKVVDGDGAARYGTGEFGFDVVCTYQDQTPYDGQVSLRAGDTITIGPYPIGTVCQVEEVVTGGATTVMMGSWDGVVTIPAPEVDGELSTVTQQATNTFDLTSLEVEKVVEGNLDARGAKGPFRVALECTWLVDGERVAFDVPGGAERVLRKSNHYSASYQDLPSSAVCVLEETEDGDAKRTAIVADIAGETVKAKGTEIEVDLSTTTGPGEATAVVTNTFLPFDKDEDGDEDRDGLPDTGAPFSPVHALLALLLLAAGGALMTRRRT